MIRSETHEKPKDEEETNLLLISITRLMSSRSLSLSLSLSLSSVHENYQNTRLPPLTKPNNTAANLTIPSHH
jgi:hypothetical protein